MHDPASGRRPLAGERDEELVEEVLRVGDDHAEHRNTVDALPRELAAKRRDGDENQRDDHGRQDAGQDQVAQTRWFPAAEERNHL